MVKAYRLTLDYNEFDFERLIEEYKKDQTVSWYVTSDYPDIKREIDKVSEKEDYSKKRFDAYIYCSNIPDRLNRFVFKGKIKGVVENDGSENECPIEEYKYKIVVEDIKAYDNKYATKLAIRRSKGVPFSPQGTYGSLNDNVLKVLNSVGEPERDLDYFIDHFTGCKCELEDIDEIGLKHSSFTKENNISYIEFHHIIFRNFGYDDSELLKKLDATECNYAQLCPACHRAIHYGNKRLRKKMIDKLLRKKGRKLEDFYNDCLNDNSFKKKIKKYKANSFKEFIYKIYDIND